MMRKSQQIPAKKRPHSTTRSAILGSVLLAIGLLGFLWIIFHQFSGGSGGISTIPLPGMRANKAPDIQITPLVAAGITLNVPDDSTPPKISQQQALTLARQLEPDAATKAKTIGSKYVLLHYLNTSTPASHADFDNVPAWMVMYQQIPADDATGSSPAYTMYVFVDATNGHELLAIRA